MKERPSSDGIRLADISAAARRIAEYTRGDRDRFLESTMVQDAVIRQLEVMGEAAGAVSERLRIAHPEVPWRELRGFASFAKHEYWRVVPLLVWKAAAECDSIRTKVERVRADEPK